MAKANVSLGGKDILDIASLSVDEIELIMKTAGEMKKILKRDIKKVPSLRGKSIITLFYENSTRTRTSFEIAGKYLGADVVNISASGSSVAKGECLRDTILTVQNMDCDARQICNNAIISPCQKEMPRSCYAHFVGTAMTDNHFRESPHQN